MLNPLNTYLNVTLPLPERSGYYFVGWYESPTFEGSPLDRFPATGDITLYAKWTTSESIYLSFCNGASFARAIPVPVGTTSITLSEESKYFVFIPTETKSYTISTSGASGPDSWGVLYDSSLSRLTSDDDDGSGNNFSITYELIAGKKYYICADVYDGSCNCSLIIS